MIASIIPLIKLPRRFGVFDYSVPGELETTLRPGQLVLVPFRTKEVFGIVQSISTASMPLDSTTKAISRAVFLQPIFSGVRLDLIHLMSKRYGLSLSSAAQLFAPPLQKRKLALVEPGLLTGEVMKNGGDSAPIFHRYTSTTMHAACLENAIRGTTLILAPTVAHIGGIEASIPAPMQSSTVVWHSQLSTKEQFERWWQIQLGEKTIIIGTRSAVFLPFHSLQSIIIENEHDENHKHWDQTPRFHVRDIVDDLAKAYGSDRHLFDVYPSVSSYAKIFSGEYALCGKQQLTKQDRLFPAVAAASLPTIVDMRDERKARNYSLLSDTATEAISTVTGDMLFFINRLGFATSVGCNDCGFVITCTTCELPLIYHETTHLLRCSYGHEEKPMPLSCPRCASPVVRLRGAGTELVEKEVRRIVGDKKTHEIIRIDSEAKLPSLLQNKARIIIGTQMALSQVNWATTELIVFVDCDKQLALPEYHASEGAWQTIQTVNFRRMAAAQFLIQTFHPDHLVFRSLKEPDRFYRTELGGRKAHGYPPYQYLVRYLVGGREAGAVAREAKMMYTKAKEALTTAQKKCTLLAPIEAQPKAFRGQYWYIIIAKLSIETWQEDLIWLNNTMPGSWKVDPNPISLLQP